MSSSHQSSWLGPSAPQLALSDRSRVFWAAVGAAGGTLIATTIYYATKDKFEQYVPLRYQYRPGTISGWLSKQLDRYSARRRRQRPVRVYMDGCFDMMHYGHANALRQAKAAGDQLVVGLIPDSEILRCKGPPVLNEQERLTLVDAVKWVDEVITGVPYDLSPEFIQELFTKHRIDYIIHGDDPCLLPDGTDAYAHAKKLGRFRMIKRTEGVSTTDIVGRMLTCTRVNPFVSDMSQPHPLAHSFSMGPEAKDDLVDSDEEEETARRTAARTSLSKFLPTSRRLVQFSNGKVAPDGVRIVYIDGAFDVFHPGHVEVLKLAKEQGDFLLVGLHTDEDVQDRRGPHLPIMNLHERSLSVLACKHVDEVIIGAPIVLSEDLIKTFNISVVVRGSVHETGHHAAEGIDSATTGNGAASSSDTKDAAQQGGALQGRSSGPDSRHNSNGGASGQHPICSEEERYAAAQAAGKFKRLASPSQHTARNIIQRIVAKRQEFEARNAKKVKSETAYYSGKKEYVTEL